MLLEGVHWRYSAQYSIHVGSHHEFGLRYHRVQVPTYTMRRAACNPLLLYIHQEWRIYIPTPCPPHILHHTAKEIANDRGQSSGFVVTYHSADCRRRATWKHARPTFSPTKAFFAFLAWGGPDMVLVYLREKRVASGGGGELGL